MSKLHSDICSLACVAGCLVVGGLLAIRVPESNSPARNPFVPAGSDQESSSAMATTASGDSNASAGQFVQEPTWRSSFMPSKDRYSRQYNYRNSTFMLRAFKEAVAPCSMSTVRLISAGRQVALGAIVASDGWIATKASELPIGESIEAILYNGSQYEVEVVSRQPEIDLALVTVAARNLPVVQWESAVPARGKWLATTDPDGSPAAVGVASAGVQRVNKSRPVLGVYLADTANEAVVRSVLPGSGAAQAGLRPDDTIQLADGQSVTRSSFLAMLGDGFAGQTIELAVVRGSREFEVTARLMDLSAELLDETEMEVSGDVSSRSTGFESVLLHDTVLKPNQCGGPLVNLDGRVVGLNIARAGRVSSYALPANIVQPVIENLIQEARLVSRSSEPRSALRPIR